MRLAVELTLDKDELLIRKPPADNVMRASTHLIGWSNGLSERDGGMNRQRREHIARELDIRIEL
jgi:hypothetical protein